MDEIANNAESERKLPSVPWPWGMFTGFVFAWFILLGVAGIILAVFDEFILYSNVPFYVQAVTSALVIILSIAETGLLVSTIKWVETVKHEQVTLVRTFRLSNNALNSGSDRSATAPTSSTTATASTGFTCCDIFVLYICLLGINTGLLIVFWSLTLAYDYRHNSFLEGAIWPFFVVDTCLGVLAPILIALSLVPVVKIVRRATNHQIETRKLYRWCLPFMGYEQGNKDCYLTINDSFYFKIQNTTLGGLDTVLIYLLAVTVFMNCWLYFINTAVVSQYGVRYCNMLTERDRFYSYCFDLYSNVGTALLINCTSNSTYSESLFCFQFKVIGQTATPVQTLTTCIVLYYITTTSISVIFQVVKGLLYYTQTQVWSNLVLLLGVLIWLLGITSLGSVYYIHTDFDLLAVLQLLAIGSIVFIVGLLLKRGHPMFTHKIGRDDKDSIALTPSLISAQGTTETIQRGPDTTETRQPHNVDTPHNNVIQLQPIEVEVIPTEQETDLTNVATVLVPISTELKTDARYSSQTITVTPAVIEGYNAHTLPRPTNLPLQQVSPSRDTVSTTAARGYGPHSLQGHAAVGRRKVTIL